MSRFSQTTSPNFRNRGHQGEAAGVRAASQDPKPKGCLFALFKCFSGKKNRPNYEDQDTNGERLDIDQLQERTEAYRNALRNQQSSNDSSSSAFDNFALSRSNSMSSNHNCARRQASGRNHNLRAADLEMSEQEFEEQQRLYLEL